MVDIHYPIINPIKKRNPLNEQFRGLLIQFVLCLSGWQDSNLRPPAPKAGAIPGYATSRTWYLLFYFPFSKGLQSNGFKLTIPFLFANFYSLRRGRDSNPRYRYQYDSLANCSFRPLRHLSFKPLFSALPALF